MVNRKVGIICPTTIIAHDNEYTLLIYCAAQSYLRFNGGQKLISPKSIAYEMGITPPLQYKKKRQIVNALDDLCDMGFAEVFQDGDYLIDTDLFYNQTDTYERISFKEYAPLKNDAGLLKHYILIKKGLINGKCTFPTTYFAEKENVSTQTISRRNKELVNLKLIRMHQSPFNEKTGKYGHNVYMLYKEQPQDDSNLFD